MSMWIDSDNVSSVLLADGWHDVKERSFDIDAYEYHHQEVAIHGGGQSGVCASGFTFRCMDGRTYHGPLTSVLAVRS